jgi:Protein of unknown function (DUF1552)
VSTYLNRRLKSLTQTLGPQDRQRLESHMQTLREVEMRIGAKTPSAPGCPVTGTIPFTPAKFDPAAPRADVPALYANMQDMVALAFACDLTRVASISFNHEADGLTVPIWVGVKDRSHHALSHRITNPVEREKFNKVMAWAAGMVSRMLDRLQALPHPEGGTLYDHTVVWWMSATATARPTRASPSPASSPEALAATSRWAATSTSPRPTTSRWSSRW